MREGIHPKYYQATVTCNCGNTFVTGRRRLPRAVSISSTGSMAWATTEIDTERDGKAAVDRRSSVPCRCCFYLEYRPDVYGRRKQKLFRVVRDDRV